ncbi:MAG: thioredoxin family protein [Flavobacterium sp.]
MKKSFYIALIFFWTIPSGFAQLKTYSFEEAEKLSKENPKPFVIFIHTDWCKFCQAMKKTTFKNETIWTKLNSDFYFVSFNAEEKRTILFNKIHFHFKPTGNNSGTHELAIALGTIKKQLVFPVLCILNTKSEIIFQHSGYLKAKELKLILEKLKE